MYNYLLPTADTVEFGSRAVAVYGCRKETVMLSISLVTWMGICIRQDCFGHVVVMARYSHKRKR